MLVCDICKLEIKPPAPVAVSPVQTLGNMTVTVDQDSNSEDRYVKFEDWDLHRKCAKRAIKSEVNKNAGAG